MTKPETKHPLRPIRMAALLATLAIMLAACGTPDAGNQIPANAAPAGNQAVDDADDDAAANAAEEGDASGDEGDGEGAR